jgi:ubiquitin-like 1-activating enzyme E1 A
MSALVLDEVEEGALRAKESALYDRQIRLWGVEAQNRMQNSKVFVLGFRGVHCEVVKNIVLAGISVVLCDRGNVSSDDLASNFFLRPDDVGRPRVNAALTRVQEYNPLTSVTAESRSLDELLENGAVYFEDFSVLLLSDCSEGDVLRLNTMSRANAGKASSKVGHSVHVYFLKRAL